MTPLRGQDSPIQRAFVAIRSKLTVIEACCEEKGVHETVQQIDKLLTIIEGIAHCPLDAECPMKNPKPKHARKKKGNS